MMVCMPCCMYDVNVCVLRQIAHRCWKTNLEFTVCKLEKNNNNNNNKRNKFLEIYLVYWIMKSNFNKFEVEH